jgi:hypothetical protein
MEVIVLQKTLELVVLRLETVTDRKLHVAAGTAGGIAAAASGYVSRRR